MELAIDDFLSRSNVFRGWVGGYGAVEAGLEIGGERSVANAFDAPAILGTCSMLCEKELLCVQNV